MRRLALVLSFMGLLTACGGDDGPDGAGTGASASAAHVHSSLAELTVLSEVAVNGVVRGVGDDASTPWISLDVKQTLWTRDGVEPLGDAVQYRRESEDAQDVAPAVGDELIVFLSRGADDSWVARGGAMGRFRVDAGIVTPAREGGISLPPDTDVAGFTALLTTEPAPSEDTSGYGSDHGYGYGGSY